MSEDTLEPKIEMERIKLERLRIYMKVVITFITIAFGPLGAALINRSIQARQLAQQERINEAQIELQKQKAIAERQQAEMRYLGEYLNYALTEDINKRLRFAGYFATLTMSESLQNKWATYYQDLKHSLEEAEKLKNALRVAEEGTDKVAVAKLESKLDFLQSTILGGLRDQKIFPYPPVEDEKLRDALQQTLSHTGGYVEDPRDPGRTINFGITLAAMQRIMGSSFSKEDLRALTVEQAMSIYAEIHFRKLGFDKLPALIWPAMIDAEVSVHGTAQKWLVEICLDHNITVELQSEALIECARQLEAKLGAEFMRELVIKRLEFMQQLKGGDLWKTFGRGWLRRLNSLLPKDHPIVVEQ